MQGCELPMPANVTYFLMNMNAKPDSLSTLIERGLTEFESASGQRARYRVFSRSRGH
jgi:hypothetical protein